MNSYGEKDIKNFDLAAKNLKLSECMSSELINAIKNLYINAKVEGREEGRKEMLEYQDLESHRIRKQYDQGYGKRY